MRILASSAAVLALMVTGCGGAQYTIPNFETDEVEQVVSSGMTPQGCIENLKEDAQHLNLKVRLTDVNHEPTGPLGMLWQKSYTCKGKVVKARS
jgi:hypothetical protein